MEQLGKREGQLIQEVCPACGMIQKDWPTGAVTVNGTHYCCVGCADGTGCTCPHSVRKPKSQPQNTNL